MNELDKNNAGLLCAAFREAIAGALTGPLAQTRGSYDSVIAALLAVTVDLSKVAGVDFTALACSMVATVDPDRDKAIGTLISCYASRD